METTPAPVTSAAADSAPTPNRPEQAAAPRVEGHSQSSGLRAALATLLTSAKSKLNISAELTAATARATQLENDLTAARASLATANAQLSALNSQLASLASFLGLQPAELAGKDAAACQSLLAAKIDAAALDAIAGMGVEPSALPRAASADAPVTFAAKIAHFNALPAGPEKDAYYAQHIAPAYSQN